ncbi:MAG: M16 family metallopeptidase [Sarcina sp.]
MIKEVLNNGVRFVYKYREGVHTSFCIGLEAGANMESDENIGVAHALEHVLFKGTKQYGENYINRRLDELFAMNNAMTNFPYVIYYGVTATEDFQEGFELYSDIVLNPAFCEDGFDEEMSVIKEESRQWREDAEQLCENLLLESAIKTSRINRIIVGDEKHIDNITMKKIKDFYNRFYVSENMVVTIIGSLQYDEAKSIVENKFGSLIRRPLNKPIIKERTFNQGIYKKFKLNNDSCKIQAIYDIESLSLKDITLLRIFNMLFGEGVSSILYDEIRTKKGLAYDVYSEVKWEKDISLYKVAINTSKENKNEVIKTLSDIDRSIEEVIERLSKEQFEKLLKRYKLKLSLEMERSIVLTNRSTIYEILFEDNNYIEDELNFELDVDIEYVRALIKKVFSKKAMMILE